MIEFVLKRTIINETTLVLECSAYRFHEEENCYILICPGSEKMVPRENVLFFRVKKEEKK